MRVQMKRRPYLHGAGLLLHVREQDRDLGAVLEAAGHLLDAGVEHEAHVREQPLMVILVLHSIYGVG